MTFKEFNEWCNSRTCDGSWNMGTAIYCIEICRKINALPFWKRKKHGIKRNNLYVIDWLILIAGTMPMLSVAYKSI